MSTRTKILAAVAVLGLLVIVLARGGEPSAQRQALEDDPMASYVPPGGTLVDSDSRNESTSSGQRAEASLTRLFQLRASERALDDAREAAADAGWTRIETAERGFLAERRVPSGEIVLAVTLIQDALLLPDELEPPALSVSVRHLGE